MTKIQNCLALAMTVAWLPASISASGRPPVDISQRINGAEAVVVASAAQVNPTWRRSQYGDQLIVSEVLLQIEDTFKGVAQPTALMELEGGTLNGVTLRVSNLPELHPGERAVFFLDHSTSGPAFVPHLRGMGILKLNHNNQVEGTSLTVEDIRRMALVAGR